MSYSHPTNVFLQIGRVNNVSPGSVLQGDKLNGILQGNNLPADVPIPSTFKNPRIKIIDRLNVNTITVPYDTDSINRALSGAISGSLNLIRDNSVFFEMGTSDDLSDFADRLNFNPNLFKKLGLYREPGAPLTSVNKRIVIFFTKPIGTFEFLIESPNTTLPNTPLNTIFNTKMNSNEAKRRIPSWWSVGNPPVYVDSVTYGSMIFLTVEYNSITGPLYDILATAANQGPNSLQTILTQIVNQPSLKTYSLGPFTDLDLDSLKTGKWIDYLFTIPSKPTAQMIQPLLYSTKDFLQLKYNAANTFEYCKICASSLSATAPLAPAASKTTTNSPAATNTPTNTDSAASSVSVGVSQYRLKLENILSYAPVILRVETMEGVAMLNLNIYYDMTYNLTPLLTSNQMKVIVKPSVGTCTLKGCFKQSVSATFLVDTTSIPKMQISCENACNENETGTYTINKTTKTVSP